MSDLGMKFVLSPSLDVGALNYVLAQMKNSLGDAGTSIKLIDPDEFNKGLDKIKEGFEDVSKGTEQVKEKVDDLDESLQKPIQSSGLLANAFKFNMIIDAVDKVSQAMTKLTDESIKYESSLKAVGAITGFAGKELDELGDKARGLAKTFGGSATDQLASFQGVLSKIGPEIAKDSTALELLGRNINILSKASGDDAATSMQAITDTMLQMGLAIGTPIEIAQKSTDVINALAASAQVGAAEIPEVAESLVVAGVAAKSANVGLIDVNAAIQVLAMGGKRGAEAGTALRNVIGYLQKATGPAAEAMASLGTSTEELGELLTTQGLDVALARIKEGMGNLGTDAEKNAALMKIFGMENSAAAGILIENADKFKEFATGIEEGMQGTGDAFEQAAIRMDTTEGMIDRMKANISDFMISLGGVVSGGIGAVLNVSAQIAPMVATFATLKSVIPTAQLAGFASQIFSKVLPSLFAQDLATKKLVLSQNMLNFANANGIATEGRSIAITLVKAGAVKAVTVAQWLWNAAMSANPIGAIIVGITALIGAVSLLSNIFSKSAKDREEDAKAEEESIDRQIASYKKKEQAVNSQKSLIATYEELGKKASRTAEEEDKFRQVQLELAKAMPGAISSTKTFSENLITLKQKLNDGSQEVDKFHKEIERLQDKKVEVNIELKRAQGEQIEDEMQDIFTGWQTGGFYAMKITQDYIKSMKQAQSSGELQEIGHNLKMSIFEDGKFSGLSATEKNELSKLAENLTKNLEEEIKLKQDDAKNKIRNIINNNLISVSDDLKGKLSSGGFSESMSSALSSGTQNVESELGKLAEANNIPLESLKKMYSEMNVEIQKNRVGEAIKESLEIKGSINASEQSKQLIDSYAEMMSRLNDLKAKKSDGELTSNEQRELDELANKAEATADKIATIAPESKTNFKTVVDEAGNLKQVYDINIEKASELVEAQKKMGNTDSQEKYNNAIIAQTEEVDKQKAKLNELKIQADKTNDPGEKQKLIDKYNEENGIINKTTQDLVTQLVNGKNAGFDISKSIEALAKSLGITTEEANKLLLAEKLKQASKDGELTKDKIKEIAGSFKVSEEAANKLYEQQKINTKEAQNTANAVAGIGEEYAKIKDQNQKDFDYNLKELQALEAKKAKDGLTGSEKARYDELVRFNNSLHRKMKADKERDEKIEELWAEKKVTTAKKTTDDIQKVIEKAEEEGRKKREEMALRSIEDDEKQARERKVVGLKKTEDEINKQIVEAEKRKNAKLITQLKENLELQKQINENELLKYDSEIAKKRLIENEKNNKELEKTRIKSINEINKVALETLQNSNTILIGVDYIENLQKQKELATQIAKDEANDKINTLIESNSEYKKLSEELLTFRTLIASKNLALNNAEANNELDKINRIKSEIEELKSKSDSTLSNIDKVINNIKNSAEAESITFKINYELDKSNSDIDDKIDKAKIAMNVKSLAEYESQIALGEARKRYKEELAMAQGNNILKTEVTRKYYQERYKLHREFLEKSLELEDVLMNAQYNFLDTFSQTFRETAITPIQEEINKLNDILAKFREVNSVEGENQYKKDVEDFKEASRQKVMSATEMFDKFDNLSRQHQSKEKSGNESSVRTRLALVQGFSSVSQSLMNTSNQHIAAGQTQIMKNIEEMGGASKVNADNLGKVFKGTTDSFVKFGVATVGAGVSQMAALMSAGMSLGEAFKKGMLVSLLDGVQKAILTYIPQIYIAFSAWLPGPWGIAAATAAIATTYSLLEVAKAKLNAKDGAVNIDGPGTETSDSIPANLSRGESVLTAAATKANGNIELLKWLNATGKPAFQYYIEERPDFMLSGMSKALSKDREFNSKAFNTLYRDKLDIEYRDISSLISEVRELRKENAEQNKRIERLIEVNESGNFSRKSAVQVDMKINTDENNLIKSIETKKRKALLNI